MYFLRLDAALLMHTSCGAKRDQCCEACHGEGRLCGEAVSPTQWILAAHRPGAQQYWRAQACSGGQQRGSAWRRWCLEGSSGYIAVLGWSWWVRFHLLCSQENRDNNNNICVHSINDSQLAFICGTFSCIVNVQFLVSDFVLLSIRLKLCNLLIWLKSEYT